MSESTGEDRPVDGRIEIEVEAAPQGLLRFTLDADGAARRWHSMLIAHDDAVIATASSPEQTAELLVRGGIQCIRGLIPSLEVGGLTMRPEIGPNDNAQIVAAGDARFLTSEWRAVTGP
ncbi:hypothetical protein [Microbacterium sp. H83]|uniref:hypothetical protein n=1 Tax=Microbacterium sp. H83 TaxID=1827324 RepID=UPI0007F414D8|nr:hypothetical protein [Microbacterium sp. H83]OAN40199.1 hypothetical protein A4X16_13360 [Microbacterium sp. H83]